MSYLYTWIRISTIVEINHLVWAIGSVYLFSIVEDKEKPIKAIIWGTTIIVVSMVIQYEILYPSLQGLFKTGRYGDLVRSKIVPTASFLNEATLGGYLLFSLPFSIYFSSYKEEKIYFLSSSLILFGILFSLSRMALFFAFISLITIGVIIAKKMGIKRLSGLFFIIIASSIIFLFLIYTTKGKTMDEIPFLERGMYKIESIPKHISTLTYRTKTWEKAINAFLDRPLTGYGSGTFEYVFKKFYDATLYTKYSHSIIIKILVELGILGLLSFFVYLFSLFLSLCIRLFFYPPFELTTKKNDKDFYIFTVISTFSGLGFALFNVAFESPAYTVTFFMLSSFFLLGLMDKKTDIDLLSFPLFIFVIFALVCSLFFTIKADTAGKLNEQGMILEELGLDKEAFNSYNEAIETMPLNNVGYIGAVGILLNAYQTTDNKENKKRLKEYLGVYLKRLEDNPDKNGELFFIKGKIYEVMDNRKEGERYLYEALAYHPSSGFYLYEIAKYHFKYGEFERLKKIIELMRVYETRHKGSDMHGIYVYKMRDLEASVEFIEGRKEKAYALARKNLEEGEKDVSSFENILSREYTPKEKVMEYLKYRVSFFKSLMD